MSSKTIDLKIIIALSLYLVSLFAANTLGLKIMPFLFGTHLSVAVFFLYVLIIFRALFSTI
jgi:hypothetical protein